MVTYVISMRQATFLKLKQLVLIVACYLIISFIITVYDHLVLHTDFSAGPRQGYSFSTEFSRNMIGGFVAQFSAEAS